MIQINDVVKSFDGFRALDGLTMKVEEGSIYGLVGPNGAGKSTILRHIMGIYRPDSGSILVHGQNVYENPAIKAEMAAIPDELYYFNSASTRDMMKFYRGLYPQFDDKRYDALREAFPEVDLDRPAALSFLHRDNPVLANAPRGYLIVRYGGLPLGFVKNLGGRCNNLHPQSRRIRMDIR